MGVKSEPGAEMTTDLSFFLSNVFLLLPSSASSASSAVSAYRVVTVRAFQVLRPNILALCTEKS